MITIGIPVHGKFIEYHLQPVIQEQSVGQQVARSDEILDHLGSLDRPDHGGCNPDHRKFLLRDRPTI
jgi:hypothetical protein